MIPLRVAAFALFTTLWSYYPMSHAQMYKCQTRDGRTSYQEHPCTSDTRQGTIKKPGAATDAAPAAASVTDKRKPEESRALGNLVMIVGVQRQCRQLLGRYVSINEMLKGCVGSGVNIGLHTDNDPGRDPNYDYRMIVRADGFELSLAPHRAGLTGYFTDGKNLYEDASGIATSRSNLLGPLPF